MSLVARPRSLAVNHVNDRRESIAAEGADKLDGQPAVGFQGVLDAGAPLDLGEEMKQRRRPQAVQVQDKALTARIRAFRACASGRFCFIS
jgi:hypothetical protein